MLVVNIECETMTSNTAALRGVTQRVSEEREATQLETRTNAQ